MKKPTSLIFDGFCQGPISRVHHWRMIILSLFLLLAASCCHAWQFTKLNAMTRNNENNGGSIRRNSDDNGALSSLLVIGLGRVGSILANKVVQQDPCPCAVVYGTKRGLENDKSDWSATMQSRGVYPIPFGERVVRDCLTTASRCRHVLVTMPPPKDFADSATATLPLEHVLRDCLPPRSWIGVVSTTGVYGDHGGDWVTESSKCIIICDETATNSKSGRLYLAWERAWQNFGLEHNHRVRIFRCAGIYGTTRSSLHTLYKNGIAVETDKRTRTMTNSPSAESLPTATTTTTTTRAPSVTNRIHEEDLTQAILASLLARESELSDRDIEIYNLSDDEPASRQVVFDFSRQLFEAQGIQPPPLQQQSLAKNDNDKTKFRSIRRRQESKRVCNQKMKQYLLPKMQYPTYREGLASILAQPNAPWWSSLEDTDQTNKD